jgi:TonB family protein
MCRGLFSLILLPALLLTGCGEEEADAVVEEPTIISNDSPFRYPVALWDDGVEGESMVMVRVNENGRVDSVYVLESSGYPALDSAAVAGARELRFNPGRRDQRRVTMWAKVPVRFNRSDPAPQTGGTP